jgi:hypothetical protein
MVGNFLARLAGAREEVLEQCPTERVKFQGIGSAILITSVIATISMWFALASALGINPVLSFPVAVAWGVIILGIDRWLVTSIPPRGKRRLAIALPRVILALLLGTLISTPIVLRAFESEINTQIAKIKQQQYNTFLSQQQGSKVDQQVTYWNAQVASLNKVIDSGGQAPLNPSADPDIQSLTKQLNAETAQEQTYYKAWQCQLYGGSGCPAGNGPLAQASHQSYLSAQRQVSVIQGEIAAREKQLSATDTGSEHNRLQQAEGALPNAKQQQANAVAQEDALRTNFENNNLVTNGLLIRLQALNQLSAGDFTVNAARFLLFLFFLVIECLPITVKLLLPPGDYDEILEATAERDRRQAMRTLRGGFDSAGSADVPGADAPAAPRGKRRRNPVSSDEQRAAARQVWQPRARSDAAWPSTGGHDSTVTARRDDSSRSQRHTSLRGMRDNRKAPTTPDGNDGPELSYDDDAL